MTVFSFVFDEPIILALRTKLLKYGTFTERVEFQNNFSLYFRGLLGNFVDEFQVEGLEDLLGYGHFLVDAAGAVAVEPEERHYSHLVLSEQIERAHRLYIFLRDALDVRIELVLLMFYHAFAFEDEEREQDEANDHRNTTSQNSIGSAAFSIEIDADRMSEVVEINDETAQLLSSRAYHLFYF